MNDLHLLKELSKNITLLYVEDEDILRQSVARYLKNFFTNIDIASNGEEGLELYKNNKYDIVLTDIRMPKLNGLDMSIKIKEINEHQNIIIVSAYSDISNFTTSIKIGVDGYILNPIDFEQLNSTLYKVIYKINQFKENEGYKKNLETLVEQKTLETKQLEEEKVKNYQKTLFALVKMIEDRDTYTGGHSQRVATYSKMIAQYMKLDDKICENIYQAGILHDIGKIAIPDTILLKPGVLDTVEYKLIQEHVSLGVDILKKVPMFEELATCIEAHHERYDGSGYPHSLKGDEILLESQIMAVCDVFDAMTTSRIYKSKKTVLEAVSEIKSLEGKDFQKMIVDAAVAVLSNIKLDETISQLPTTALEQERFAYFYKDQITKCYNSNYFDLMLIKNSYNIKYKYIYLIAIHNLNDINIKYSWEEGNSYLENVSLNLQMMLNLNEVFRVYSDDFLVLTEEKIELDIEQLSEFIVRDDVSFNVESYNIEENKIFSFHDFELLKKI